MESFPALLLGSCHIIVPKFLHIQNQFLTLNYCQETLEINDFNETYNWISLLFPRKQFLCRKSVNMRKCPQIPRVPACPLATGVAGWGINKEWQGSTEYKWSTTAGNQFFDSKAFLKFLFNSQNACKVTERKHVIRSQVHFSGWLHCRWVTFSGAYFTISSWDSDDLSNSNKVLHEKKLWLRFVSSISKISIGSNFPQFLQIK